jgi:prenyltransferase beta subunit
VLALANAADSDGPSSDAVDFLAGQQCSDGAFQVAIRTDLGTDCATSDEDVDTTAYAIQALLAAGHHGGVSDALAWLASVENHNGGWGEGAGDKSDANSTALAIEALIAAHRSDAAPLTWLRKQQLGCGAPPKQFGAVTFSGHQYTKATAIRATSQAGVALAGKSLAQVDSNGESGPQPPQVCPAHHKR